MRRTLTILLTIAGLLAFSSVWAQTPAKAPAAPDSTRPVPGQRHRERPRFIDLNGDGINDLAPDLNGDGLPDALDPMFQGPQARHRMGWFRMIPDSARTDSSMFRNWWEGMSRPQGWRVAWTAWRDWADRMDNAGGMPGMGNSGMSPRGNRFQPDNTSRRQGGGMGPGGGGGRGGGGGGGRGGGHGGGGMGGGPGSRG